ncbi:hypothetical protein LA66_18320 [Aureimonas altamirensis]|uniref:Uncharacterized protein n=1 Tax=Aureimonas altamirensis TaxID=370622 RepID=A0A0B1PZ21_9HYPH|nr:hypothetical protein LA66_18320 [Aureimonas altamirensis]
MERFAEEREEKQGARRRQRRPPQARQKDRREQAADEQIAQEPQRYDHRPFRYGQEAVGQTHRIERRKLVPFAGQKAITHDAGQHDRIPGDKRHQQRLRLGPVQPQWAHLGNGADDEIAGNDAEQRDGTQPHDARQQKIDDIEHTFRGAGIHVIRDTGLNVHEHHHEDADGTAYADAV